MKKYTYKLIIILCLLTSIIRAEKPMNVLFISIDDLNTDLGCYGNKQVKTPNLDRLANMGIRFDRAYCQQPVCGPSRASVMTGLRPNSTKCYTLKDDFRKTKPDTMTMGQFFQEKDYYVARVGKIYHYGNPAQIGTDGHDDPATWQEKFNPVGIDKSQEHEIYLYPGGQKGIKGKRRSLGRSMSWWDPVSKDEEHTDGKVASKAIELIAKHKNKPFFIAAGFFNPHCPYVAPKKYFDMYPLKDISMPNLDKAKEDIKDIPKIAIGENMKKNWPYWLGSKISIDEARRCKQAYYACISFVDAQVGRLLDALKEHKILDNTLIVTWSDHGYFIGEKGFWYKRKAFERAVRTPLIIYSPKLKERGLVCKQPVELLDMYPTIVDQTGFTVPNFLEGKSLTPLLFNPKALWNKPAISQVHRGADRFGYSIRTERWRYTEWIGGKAGKELYDHDIDPFETTNLARNKDYSDTMNKLSTQLKPYVTHK